jgi:hypothetical protein
VNLPFESVVEMPSEKIKIAIDRGGTFTDCIGSYKGKEEIVKLLSVDPNNYDDAPLEGIRRLLEKFTGKRIAREDKLDTSLIGMLFDIPQMMQNPFEWGQRLLQMRYWSEKEREQH